jgi:hypothetical protein
MSEDETSFDAREKATDDAPTRERRAHAWIQRERMAWVAIAATVASMAAGVWLRLEGVITNGQWVLGTVLLFFIGGKSLVEAFVTIKGPR